MGFKGMVVVHSVNEAGAKAMKSYLPQARVAPFGTFELGTVISRNPIPRESEDNR